MLSDEIFNDVIGRELSILNPMVRRNENSLRQLIHPDFIEFGASGKIWDLDSIVEVLINESGEINAPTQDIEASEIDSNTILITYKIIGGSRDSLRSSIWVRVENGEWLLRFHQGTALHSQ